MKFAGSHKAVAECVHRRLGGRVQEEAFGEKYVIYDSVKGKQAEGLTHYAITVGRISANDGFAEWRIMAPPRRSGPGQARTREVKLSDAMVEHYWKSVQDCAAQR